MVINYKKDKYRLALISGLVWLALSIFSFIYNSGSYFLVFAYFLAATFFLAQYFYKLKYPYLSINDNIVVRHSFPKKTFDLKKLRRINRNSAGIKLVSEVQNDLMIMTSFIDKHSLSELEKHLELIEKEKSN